MNDDVSLDDRPEMTAQSALIFAESQDRICSYLREDPAVHTSLPSGITYEDVQYHCYVCRDYEHPYIPNPESA